MTKYIIRHFSFVLFLSSLILMNDFDGLDRRTQEKKHKTYRVFSTFDIRPRAGNIDIVVTTGKNDVVSFCLLIYMNVQKIGTR